MERTRSETLKRFVVSDVGRRSLLLSSTRSTRWWQSSWPRSAAPFPVSIKDGKIVYERYLNRADAKTHFNSYSMAKSFNSILVGLAIADGHIRSVLDPVEKYVPELKNSGYGGTTIKDLLEMRSGVEWNDNFFAEGSTAHKAHVAAWVEGSARYTDFAAGAKRAHPPGTVFNYDTMDAAVVGLVVERAVKMPISRYLSDRLWKPAGMESYAFYVIDGPPGIGREFSGGGFNLCCATTPVSG